MYRNILEWPHPKLRKSAASVKDFGKTSLLIQDLIDTLNVEGGVGLAAPQIGQMKRVFVVDFTRLPCENISPSTYNESFGVFINPVLKLTGEVKQCEEACLSVPYVSAKTPRNTEAHVTWYNESGEKQETVLTGYLSQIIQHENDHLDGTVYLQRLSPMKRTLLMEKMRKIKKKKHREEKRRLRSENVFR